MSTHKHIDRICVVVTVISLLLTVLFMNGKSLGISALSRSMDYESTLFDTTRVHSIDIVIDDWDSFLETAVSEEYTPCSVVIDNDSVKNAAIRGKGNTSLSTVASMGSERYSFKIEFDYYESGKSYKGLDKLCLNNIIQDNTYMKDYLTYRMMSEFGVDTPLCSYVWVTVNGEDWGLYQAVEAVEDSFLSRVYNGEGDLYKPDSMSMGGGPGNGRDFNMDDFMNENADAADTSREGSADSGDSEIPQSPGGGTGSQPQFPNWNSENAGDWPEMPGMPDMSEVPFGEGMTPPEMPDGMGGGPGMPGGSKMGSEDVRLQYIDDDPDSYSNIFDNAKTVSTAADQARLIRSLKSLGEGENLEDVLDTDEVLRYFVVHNFTVNGDSYTGMMVHNYYLHESDGKLSMIPWDYNLAFGTFQNSSATSAVNDPIDTPLSVSGDGSRPMADWIFQSEEYTELYHRYFSEFLAEIDMEAMIDETYALIAEYVKKDPTAFCSYEEFETGVAALRSFCEKRTESIRGQLDGTIPSTDAGQAEDASALIDASDLTLSDMGSMGVGKGSPGNGFDGNRGGNQSEEDRQPGGKEETGPGDSSPQNDNTDSDRPAPPDGETGTPPQNGSGEFPPQNGGAGSDRPIPPGGGMGALPQNGGDAGTEQRTQPFGGTESPSDDTESDRESLNRDRSAQPDSDRTEENDSAQRSRAQLENAQTEPRGLLSLAAFDGNAWLLLGISVLVLAAAVLFAKRFRRH